MTQKKETSLPEKPAANKPASTTDDEELLDLDLKSKEKVLKKWDQTGQTVGQ